MKLLYITNAIDGSGGLERVLSIKSSYLAEHFGYNIHILTLNSRHKKPFYNFSSSIKFHDIEVEGNLFSYLLKYKKGIQEVIENMNPDVISVCDDGLKGLLFPLIFGKNIPVIYERHASVKLNFTTQNRNSVFKKLKTDIEHKLMIYGAKQFHSFIVLTNGNKSDWPNVKCKVIPNPNSFHIDDSDRATKKLKTVLAVGSQSYNKGYDRLILAWHLVHQKYPDWKLKIYGKKNDNLNLQESVNSFGLNNSITFHSPIKNIEEQYKKAAIFVLPSRSEGFGMVLIEAMSYGVPCVSFDCPHGPADIIKNGEDGFLIENGNIESFGASIIELMEDEVLRKKFGDRAKVNVMRYSPDKIVPMWDALFKSLVN